MLKLKVFITGILFFSAGLQGIFAQQLPEIKVVPAVDQVFAKGVILFNNGNFAEAQKTFARLIEGKNRWHHLLTASLIMHAKSSYWLGDFQTVQDDIRQLLTLYPETKYLGQAHLLIGLIQFKKNDAYNAAKQLLLAMQDAKSIKLQQKTEQLATILLNHYLTLSQLNKLKNEPFEKAVMARIVLAESSQYLSKNNPQKAQALVEDFLDKNPNIPYANTLRAFLKDKIKRVLNINRIGVILPLTGDFAEEGRRLAAGIQFAENEIKKKGPGSINAETVIQDSESNMIRAIYEAQNLIHDPNVVCLVGELENIITAGLAGVAEASGISMVAPTATDNGIAKIGPHIFQASPDLEMQARALAEYAITVDSLRTFITIAPHDSYGQQMVDAFSEEVDRLGGEIITQRWYYDVPENLGRQFKEIREIAFRRVLEDTLRLRIPNFAQLDKDSLWKDFNERFMLENNEKEPIVELSSSYPVTNIDGVFLPIYKEDIQYVARQLRYFNIAAQILGGEYWYLDDLEKQKQLLRYINNTIFVSSYFYDSTSLEYKNFRNRFRQEMGTTPERWELFGYDTAKFIFSLLDQKKISREQMQNLLQSRNSFMGRKGLIHFAKGRRVNDAVHILQIRGSEIYEIN